MQIKISIKVMACALAAMLFCGAANAQNKRIFVATSSKQHPNERPIWSERQAQEWFDRHSPIIGINHPEPPCDAVSQDEALQRAAQIGYNSVRWWPGSWNYIQSVEEYAKIADKHGINCAPVFGFTHVPTSASDSADMEKKVREIIRYFRGDERVIMWDIWNEPLMSGELRQADGVDSQDSPMVQGGRLHTGDNFLNSLGPGDFCGNGKLIHRSAPCSRKGNGSAQFPRLCDAGGP